ncbi:squalene synthase HpnC [Aureimonas endophytica]|uniref:Squalene synthase HpnC n=1 Tax=Aureimonas endophytica TaxID=2027858 RepID=A0A917EA71_9HYPH|nr:squalene synthase HpnC [Aureimonas endophytica]GGE17810.1 squalene synthase HpnC [Aureimonas endophytica]
MTVAAKKAFSKTHRGENFPVASRLVAARHRPAILAFYRFARAADDIADDPAMEPDEKLRQLDAMEATLFGEADLPHAVPLRQILAERHFSARHPCDLLAAFRRDVTKTRYRDWDDLMDYCSVSAMPVGRFVLDVHGERQSTWEASDALCAALQVINHLQDCAKDHRELDRVYLPLDTLQAHGAKVEDLARPKATSELRQTIAALAEATAALLTISAPLARDVRDRRLGLEIAAIQRLAEVLVARLRERDPLGERVHLGKAEAAMVSVRAMLAAYADSRDLEKARRRRRAGPKP